MVRLSSLSLASILASSIALIIVLALNLKIALGRNEKDLGSLAVFRPQSLSLLHLLLTQLI